MRAGAQGYTRNGMYLEEVCIIYGMVCIQTGGSGKVSTRTRPRARGVDEDASSARAISAVVGCMECSGWEGSAQLADCCTVNAKMVRRGGGGAHKKGFGWHRSVRKEAMHSACLCLFCKPWIPCAGI